MHTLGVRVSLQETPTLGPKVCSAYLLWATWTAGDTHMCKLCQAPELAPSPGRSPFVGWGRGAL